MVHVERLAAHHDARGSVFEPLSGAAIAGQRNVHVGISVPGAVRGNHLHRHATEILTVTGPALVRWRDGGAIEELEVAAYDTVRFTFPPGVSHAVRNTGQLPGVLVSFRDAPSDADSPDVERDVLIPD
jgi:UDP-2-acetamido-2,6-beta-L-arabino-hexul-4-ose reductase